MGWRTAACSCRITAIRWARVKPRLQSSSTMLARISSDLWNERVLTSVQAGNKVKNRQRLVVAIGGPCSITTGNDGSNSHDTCGDARFQLLNHRFFAGGNFYFVDFAGKFTEVIP